MSQNIAAARRQRAKDDRKRLKAMTFSASGSGPGLRDFLAADVIEAARAYKRAQRHGPLERAKGRLQGAVGAYRTTLRFLDPDALEPKANDTLHRLLDTYPRWRGTPDNPWLEEGK